MKHVLLASFLALALSVTSFSPAEARWHGGYGHRYHHNNHGWETAAIVGGALLGTALLIDAASPRYYEPPPAYYPPQQAYYAPPRAVYYAPTPRYYVSGPYGYYAPAAAYYPY